MTDVNVDAPDEYRRSLLVAELNKDLLEARRLARGLYQLTVKCHIDMSDFDLPNWLLRRNDY